ncbi:hypothetical protein J31TS4_22070 [Paenibacillus sp. J31TS4]|uniref:coat protein F n=1 Tax=Paenibacillus sp. J31TS4 TaxID=2807195 RepID=UPI001B14055B|nr:coat protein F [Paenibacillus sp. J31TS4]GIP38927.1 hypothetical protein J31TS4_22070 [Paenibacillus sp. J31TS4]
MAETKTEHRRLAPHETLEIHEMLASKTNGLVNLKRTYPTIQDPQLRQLYLQCIRATEQQIQELVALLQQRAVPVF